MKFIADENVARLVIRHLRDIGHDVVSIIEAGLVSTDDDDIIAMGSRERRIIITHDKDFGHVLRYPLKKHSGVILIRLRYPTPRNTWNAVQRVLEAVPEGKMRGRVVVVEETRIRLSGREVHKDWKLAQ